MLPWGKTLQAPFSDLYCRVLPELIGRDSVPAAYLLSADKCTGEKVVIGLGRRELDAELL